MASSTVNTSADWVEANAGFVFAYPIANGENDVTPPAHTCDRDSSQLEPATAVQEPPV